MEQNKEYQEFLESKKHSANNYGIATSWLPDSMFDFQKYVTEHSIKKGRCAGFIDTGLGKTLIELTIAKNFVESTNKRTLLITPLAVAFQHLQEADKFGIGDISYSKDGTLKSKIVICNYERLHLFDANDFDCVILDECFAPDTKIQIYRKDCLHDVYIKDCLIGDKVLNCTGLDSIKGIKKRKINYAIKISYNGKQVISSPKHPYFTQRGWVAAKDLQRGDTIVSTDKAMRILRGQISYSLQSTVEDSVLRDILLSEMENEAAGSFSKSPQSRSGSKARKIKGGVVKDGRGKTRDREDKKSKSNVELQDPKEGFGHIEGNRPQTFSAWGKWSRNDIATAINEGCIVRKLDSGICYITGQKTKGLPDQLQSRLSELASKNCNRSGWIEPSQQERNRSQEGQNADFFRVDSFEILESGHYELDKYRDESGSLYFYDLEITSHPSFTINGGLVHNSSILKNFDGATRQAATSFMKKVKYRYLFTATPSPNDYIELGTSSEALGYLGYTDMLTRFFTNNEDTISPQNIGTEWILKGHAKENFFKWVSGWSISMRKPSDLGFDDTKFILPELVTNYHSIKNDNNMVINGQILMFNLTARRLTEVREEQKGTIEKRCAKAFELASQHDTSVYWCNLNKEGDLIKELDKSAYQIKGSMDLDEKEELLISFFKGEIKKLITKPKMTAFGLNWQHCSHTTYFPTFSYEQYYQAIRRFWRFGQKRKVTVDMVYSDGQQRVLDSLLVKSDKANELFSKLNSNLHSNFDIKEKQFTKQIITPKW